MRIALAILNGVLTVLYPLAIWWSLTHHSARTTGLMVLLLLVPLVAFRVWRAARKQKNDRQQGEENDKTNGLVHLIPIVRIPLAVMALMLIGVVTNNGVYIKAMPVLISLALLIVFGTSLRGEMPIVERFARLQDANLSVEKQQHCREVTRVWCGFFIVNGLIAAVLAVAAPVFWWAAYTSGLAYALMGVLFAGEYIVRKARFRDYSRAPHDRLLARLFPPDSKDMGVEDMGVEDFE